MPQAVSGEISKPRAVSSSVDAWELEATLATRSRMPGSKAMNSLVVLPVPTPSRQSWGTRSIAASAAFLFAASASSFPRDMEGFRPLRIVDGGIIASDPEPLRALVSGGTRAFRPG